MWFSTLFSLEHIKYYEIRGCITTEMMKDNENLCTMKRLRCPVMSRILPPVGFKPSITKPRDRSAVYGQQKHIILSIH